MSTRLVSGLLGALLLAAPVLAKKPAPLPPNAAFFNYTQMPNPAKADDLDALVADLERVAAKDEFESTKARAARLDASSLKGRQVRFLIESTHVSTTPYPDEGVYLVALATPYSPQEGRPAIIDVAYRTIEESPTVFQNAFGAEVNGTRTEVDEIKIAVTNWNSLNAGLVWKSKKERYYKPQQLGAPFKDPSPELLELMKSRRLGLWIRVQIGDLSKVTVERGFSPATLQIPMAVSRRTVTIPAELLALGVVSEDGATSYALWSREQQAEVQKNLAGKKAK